tara:strand:+ start:1004 stop:1219 length:216 start_codon:yes stop_codon:yes gene_type:complete
MAKKYKRKTNDLFEMIPSPEYNRIVMAIVKDSKIQIEKINYKVTNAKNTVKEVPLVIFPDGTAEVIENIKF